MGDGKLLIHAALAGEAKCCFKRSVIRRVEDAVRANQALAALCLRIPKLILVAASCSPLR